MTESKQEAIYVPKGSGIEESLIFSIRLCTSTTEEQRFQFHSVLGAFVLIAEGSNDNYSFKIDTAESDYLILNQFKQCSVGPVKGDGPFVTSLLYKYFGIYEIAEEITREHLDTMEGSTELHFSFSVECLPTYSSMETSFTDAMMMGLFLDTSDEDVTFVCNEVVASNGEISQTAPEKSESAADRVTKTFGARKLILSQWPYFKTLFAEGDTGNREIHVQDVNAEAFRKTLFFLYHGVLDSPPDEILENSDPAMAKAASWEGLYLAAQHYRIDDLRKQALDKILGHLDKADAMAFLFRSAYLFEQLRLPLVKFVAKECHSDIAKRATREKYLDHPEYSELLGELLEAYHNIREN